MEKNKEYLLVNNIYNFAIFFNFVYIILLVVSGINNIWMFAFLPIIFVLLIGRGLTSSKFLLSFWLLVINCNVNIFIHSDGFHGKGATFAYYIPIFIFSVILLKNHKYHFYVSIVFNFIIFLLSNILLIGPKVNQNYADTNALDFLFSLILSTTLVYNLIKVNSSFEKQLEENHNKLDSIVENTNDFIWSIDTNKNLLFGNTRFINRMKQRLGKVLHKGDYLLQYQSHLKETEITWNNYYQRALSGEVFSIEEVHEVETGSATLLFTFNPIYDNLGMIIGATIFGRNITEVKNAQKEIEETKMFFEKIFDAMPNNIAVLDNNCRYIYVNPSCIRDPKKRKLIIGMNDLQYSEETGFRKDYAIMRFNICLELTKIAEKNIESIYELQSKPVELVEEYKNQDDKVTSISRQFIPVLENGKLKYIVHVGFDFTDLKEKEAELTKVNKEKENALNVRQHLLSTMSHEIRTPINALVSIADMFVNEVDPNERADKLQIIKESSDYLLKTVNDILDYTKIDENKIELEKVPFNLYHALHYVLSNFESNKKENLNIFVEIGNDVPVYVNGDEHRLKQVLINLIGNAIKFTEKGSIILKVNLIKKFKDFCNISFEVKDTGIGIAQENLTKIFDVFTQAESNTTRRFGGSGLGLSIVKKIIELHQSFIEVQSTPNVGTSFSFILTYEYSNQLINNKIEDKIDFEKLKNKKVLIVDDNPVNIYITRKQLQKIGIIVNEAHNGQEALDSYSKQDYNLIIMDIQMPVMDGIEASKKIRSLINSDKSKIPIIAFTADIMLETQNEIIAAGIDYYLQKPVTPEKLYQSIDLLLV